MKTISVDVIRIVLIMTFLLNLSCSPDHDRFTFQTDAPISLEFGNKLLFESDENFNGYRDLIEQVVRETIIEINEQMPISNVVIAVRSGNFNIIPEIGMGGFNPNRDEVIITIKTDFEQLENTINTLLKPLLAHEMHHAKRRRLIGYGTTLLQAIVSEGMADHFSTELAGIEPPVWSTVLTESELEVWIENASLHYSDNSYNHADWFYGANDTIPRWTGYAIGYELLKKYKAEHPTANASNLVGEPAAIFADN